MSNLEDNNILKVIWILSRVSGFGIQRFKRLQEKAFDLSQLCHRDVLEDLSVQLGLGAEFISQFENMRQADDFEKEMDQCQQRGIHILSLLDADYPKNLAMIYDPPLVLYVKGKLIHEDEAGVAVVGTRHPSAYGVRMANKFARELAQRGMTVISGLARGIDAEAHRGALLAHGRTIAVLGSGLDVVYPKEHVALYEQIVGTGAVISEFPLGTLPLAFNFPKRNRIICGLSLGVLVVEASQRSGSLITASVALEEGREVYAVPGQADSLTSLGTNQLIQKGAKLVASTDDIFDDLSPQVRAFLKVWRSQEKGDKSQEITSPSLKEKCLSGESLSFGDESLLKLLAYQPLYFDEIVSKLGGNAEELHLHLTQLELAGYLKRDFGGRYSQNEVMTKA